MPQNIVLTILKKTKKKPFFKLKFSDSESKQNIEHNQSHRLLKANFQ